MDDIHHIYWQFELYQKSIPILVLLSRKLLCFDQISVMYRVPVFEKVKYFTK